MSIVAFLVIAALAVVIALKVFKRSHTLGGKTRAGGHERELYRKLLGKAFGDKAQVERLIEVERRRKPNASRAVLMRNAIDRWEHHNR